MAKQPRSLTRQVAAITGGGRGIGRATAQSFVREGMKVAIGDIDVSTARKTAEELGGGTIALELNVTDRASFQAFLEEVESQLGPLDVLVNNAGIMQLGPFLEEDDATAHRQVDINLHGVLYGMKLALPGMRSRRRGHLVNIASTAGKTGFPGGATYCATKHAVVGVSEAVRWELRGTGVEVSVVMPGVVNTELASGLKAARGVRNVDPEEVAAAIVTALKFPHFDVFVPKSIAVIQRFFNLIPRRAAELIARALRADRVLVDIDQAQRLSYEDRASHSEPGLEPEALPAPVEETTVKSEPEPLAEAEAENGAGDEQAEEEEELKTAS